MTTVQRWSGTEIRALREAKRMSVREFAAHLGVSDRMVSKWEVGAASIYPRPVNQAALDTVLAHASHDARRRFTILVGEITIAPGTEEITVARPPARHPVDGKLMALIEGGVFLRGPGNEPCWLAAYQIDVYPTTNADYARFVEATQHRTPAHWIAGKCPSELQDHPVVYVTWQDAHAYAHWAGKQLPTSQQWERAARGTRGDIYPWGNRPTPAKCNVREADLDSTTPVDRYQSGASPEGVYDMCGNVWEWCSTQTTPQRYELKGGAFTSLFARATPSTFNDASEEMNDDDTSFRCVSSR